MLFLNSNVVKHFYTLTKSMQILSYITTKYIE